MKRNLNANKNPVIFCSLNSGQYLSQFERGVNHYLVRRDAGLAYSSVKFKSLIL